MKAQSQQLELAHKQLDSQQQELRQLQEAAAGSSRSLAAMEQEKSSMKDQLADLKRELGAGEGREQGVFTAVKLGVEKVVVVGNDCSSLLSVSCKTFY